MTKFQIGRVGKYLIPVALVAPLAVGIGFSISHFSPEKAEAALGSSSSGTDTRLKASTSRVALLIANSDYADASAPLAHPLRDMQALAEELRRTGFAVEVAHNLGKDELRRTVDAFQTKVQPGSAAFLAYSGHGIQASRQNYMIPVNAQIWKETDVSREGISIESVLAGVDSRGAKVKLVVLDASRRNPFERRFRGYSAGMAPVTAPSGSLVISATPPGKIADDIEGGSGLLVSELLKEIPATSSSAEQIFHRTRMGVSKASQGEQVPAVSSSLTEEFAFVETEARYASLSRELTTSDALLPLPVPRAGESFSLAKGDVSLPAKVETKPVEAAPVQSVAPKVEPAAPPPVTTAPVQRAEASPAPPPAPKAESSTAKPAPAAADDDDDDKGRPISKRARKAVDAWWDYDRRIQTRHSTHCPRTGKPLAWGTGRRYSMHLGVGH